MIKITTRQQNGRDEVIAWQVADNKLDSDPNDINITTIPFGPVASKTSQFCQTSTKVYVYGGVTDSGETVGHLWEYDIATKVWKQLVTNTNPMYDGSMVIINNVLYALGGIQLSAATAIQSYDLGTNVWSTVAIDYDFIKSGSAVVYNDEIYMIGGYELILGVPTYNTNIVLIDPIGVTSTTLLAVPPKELSDHGMVLSGTTITIGSGLENDGSTDNVDVLIYDLIADSWRSVGGNTKLGIGVNIALDPVNNGSVLLFGGATNTVVLFDPNNDTFATQTAVTDKTEDVFWVDATSVSQFGGANVLANDTAVINFTANSNGGIITTLVGVPCLREEHAFDVKVNKVTVVGGLFGSLDPYFSDVWTFDITLGTWVNNGDLPEGRAYHDIIPVNGEEYVVFGGNDKVITVLGDVNNPTYRFNTASGTSVSMSTPFAPPTSGWGRFDTGTFYHVQGGLIFNTLQDYHAILDTINFTWTVTAQPGEEMDHHGMIIDNNITYRLGGIVNRVSDLIIDNELTLGNDQTILDTTLYVKGNYLYIEDGNLYSVGGDLYDSGLTLLGPTNKTFKINTVDGTITEVMYTPADVDFGLGYQTKFRDDVLFVVGGDGGTKNIFDSFLVMEPLSGANNFIYIDNIDLPISTIDFGLNFHNFEVIGSAVIQIGGTMLDGRVIAPGNVDNTLPMALPRANTVNLFANL